ESGHHYLKNPAYGWVFAFLRLVFHSAFFTSFSFLNHRCNPREAFLSLDVVSGQVSFRECQRGVVRAVLPDGAELTGSAGSYPSAGNCSFAGRIRQSRIRHFFRTSAKRPSFRMAFCFI
ncbi:hypothetical protein, partial [Pseudocitrobacter sp. RIT415]|uniref:hypothetical protein n=1 Tax=Pseudocitrobacter sp. RIT415 TaxID=2202163 RepID=UPI001F2A03F4